MIDEEDIPILPVDAAPRDPSIPMISVVYEGDMPCTHGTTKVSKGKPFLAEALNAKALVLGSADFRFEDAPSAVATIKALELRIAESQAAADLEEASRAEKIASVADDRNAREEARRRLKALFEGK